MNEVETDERCRQEMTVTIHGRCGLPDVHTGNCLLDIGPLNPDQSPICPVDHSKTYESRDSALLWTGKSTWSEFLFTHCPNCGKSLC
jgi:hypothetical protein